MSPKDVELFDLKTPIIMDTGDGPRACTEHVHIKDIMFLELSLTRKHKRMKCAANEHNLGCDSIVGQIFLRQIGINIDFDDSGVT